MYAPTVSTRTLYESNYLLGRRRIFPIGHRPGVCQLSRSLYRISQWPLANAAKRTYVEFGPHHTLFGGLFDVPPSPSLRGACLPSSMNQGIKRTRGAPGDD